MTARGAQLKRRMLDADEAPHIRRTGSGSEQTVA